MSKKKLDWLLYALVLVLVIDIILFILGTSGSLPPLDIIVTSGDGNTTITFTGISEIIVAFACAAGIFIRMTRKK